MKPSELYQQRSAEFNLQPDDQQQAIAAQFDQLWQRLQSTESVQSSWLSRLWSKSTAQTAKGLYIWGGVGRGKTMLMDVFYDSLTVPQKQRLHFHRFMQQVHYELKQLNKVINPLNKIAEQWSQRAQVLCLDEFHVSDITDAMLLAGLLTALFERGVCLVTTSNIPPDELYRNGLQRTRFLPAIDLLKQHTDVVNLDSNTDYRLMALKKGNTYIYPLSDDADKQVQSLFTAMTTGEDWAADRITVNDREIKIKGEGEGVVWFEFDELCNTPRSQADYLEIACEHHSVFISNLPQLTDTLNEAARRFLHLLDILYDHQVKLIISAAVAIDEIYQGSRLQFEYERAKSRLIEMQSEQYLAREHILS